MKLVRRVIRYMLALWDCISSFPRFVMVNVGFLLTVQSISPYFLPRGITVRIIYVYVYILWVEKFFFPTLYSGQVWIFYWQYKVFHHRSMSFCILLSFMLILRGTKLGCFGISLSVNVFQTGLFMLGMGWVNRPARLYVSNRWFLNG